MTTAHRPTFDPARGKDAQRGPAYHQRLQPAHMHLKTRQAGQGGTGDQARRDLRAELFAAEAAAKARKQGGGRTGQDADDERSIRGEKRKMIKPGDGSFDEDASDSEETKRRRLLMEKAAAEDAESESSDEDGDGAEDSAGSSDDDDEDDDDDDDSDDEQGALMRELAKIKAERAAQKEAEDAAKAREDEDARMVEIARGNPLLNTNQDFGVKRRWDEDVVFRNQARGTEEKGKRKEFVNDLLRSDFHKRFMSKYVR